MLQSRERGRSAEWQEFIQKMAQLHADQLSGR
jgi:hypothetical protein